jgi:hypothetical protein
VIPLQAFPTQLSQREHDPFFSLEEPETWAKPEAVAAYIHSCHSGKLKKLANDSGLKNATPKELKSFCDFVSIE